MIRYNITGSSYQPQTDCPVVPSSLGTGQVFIGNRLNADDLHMRRIEGHLISERTGQGLVSLIGTAHYRRRLKNGPESITMLGIPHDDPLNPLFFYLPFRIENGKATEDGKPIELPEITYWTPSIIIPDDVKRIINFTGLTQKLSDINELNFKDLGHSLQDDEALMQISHSIREKISYEGHPNLDLALFR